MTTTEALEKIKVFGMTNQMLCEDLQRVETQYKIELGHVGRPKDVAEASYYAQFDVAVRVEAATMREHYEVFYCLEKSIRSIISETLEEAEKANWWDTARIPEIIKNDVKGRIQKEVDTGMTRRSADADRLYNIWRTGNDHYEQLGPVWFIIQQPEGSGTNNGESKLASWSNSTLQSFS